MLRAPYLPYLSLMLVYRRTLNNTICFIEHIKKVLASEKDNYMPTHIPFDSAALQNILERCRELPGAMLPVLHEVQDTFGYIPEEGVSVIAKALNVSRAEVHGVVTFYHHFRDKPAGHTVVQICRAEACQSLGADDLCLHAQTS